MGAKSGMHAINVNTQRFHAWKYTNSRTRLALWTMTWIKLRSITLKVIFPIRYLFQRLKVDKRPYLLFFFLLKKNYISAVSRSNTLRSVYHHASVWGFFCVLTSHHWKWDEVRQAEKQRASKNVLEVKKINETKQWNCDITFKCKMVRKDEVLQGIHNNPAPTDPCTIHWSQKNKPS